MKIRALHLPPGTRIEAVTQHVDGFNSIGDSSVTQPILTWKVWLGIANKQVPPEQYQGTYLELLPDGSVLQCTTDEPEYEVMESMYDIRGKTGND